MKGERASAYWVAVGFGAGLVPVISGTIGTIPFWVAMYLWARWGHPSLLAVSVVSLICIVVGFWSASRAEEMLGSHDPKQIVIDEWAGMAVSLIGVPPNLKGYIWAFFLFRVYDVIKPPPARQLEQLPGGYGIVLDDVFAGFYALVTYQLLHWVLPAVF